MRERARFFWGALFFLCGLAAFASLPWIQKIQIENFRNAEPYFRCPVPVFSDRVLVRSDPFGKGSFGALRGKRNERRHEGIDLLVGVGNPVFASKSGRVAFAGIGKGYGWYVELAHPDGRSTRYAHLSSLSVSPGQWVFAGQKLGLAGKSGNADAPRILPHLHFEILQNGRALDPMNGLLDPALLVK